MSGARRATSPAVAATKARVAAAAADQAVIAIEADVFAFLLLIMGPQGNAAEKKEAQTPTASAVAPTPTDAAVPPVGPNSTDTPSLPPADSGTAPTPVAVAALATAPTSPCSPQTTPLEPPLVMGGLWKEKMPRMKLMVYQLDRLLRWGRPRLHAHLSLRPRRSRPDVLRRGAVATTRTMRWRMSRRLTPRTPRLLLHHCHRQGTSTASCAQPALRQRRRRRRRRRKRRRLLFSWR